MRILVRWSFRLFILEQEDLARVLLVWLEDKLFTLWSILFTILRWESIFKFLLQRSFINFTLSLNWVTRLKGTWKLFYLRFAFFFFISTLVHQLIVHFMSKVWDTEWFLDNLGRKSSKRTAAFIRLDFNLYVVQAQHVVFTEIFDC